LTNGCQSQESTGFPAKGGIYVCRVKRVVEQTRLCTGPLFGSFYDAGKGEK